MANYLATDTDLAAVASAIRTKGGTNANLSFPNGFISAIQAIPTSGGGSSFKCDYGEFTLDEDYNPATTPYSVDHDLGEVPEVVIVYPNTDSGKTPGTQGYAWFNHMVDVEHQYASSAALNSCPIYSRIYLSVRNDETIVNVSGNQAESYTLHAQSNRLPTSTQFKLHRVANGVVWAAGDYKYFVSEGWWLKSDS